MGGAFDASQRPAVPDRAISRPAACGPGTRVGAASAARNPASRFSPSSLGIGYAPAGGQTMSNVRRPWMR